MSFVGTRPEVVKYVKKYKPEYLARLQHDYRLHPDAFEWMPDQVRYGPLQDWLRYIKSDHEPILCQRNPNRGTPNDGT